MSQRFHRGMVEQYKGRKVVTDSPGPFQPTLLCCISFFGEVLNLIYFGFAFSGELFSVCRPLSVEQGGGDGGCARSLCFHHSQVGQKTDMIMKSTHVGILLTRLSHGTVTPAGSHENFVQCSTHILPEIWLLE